MAVVKIHLVEACQKVIVVVTASCVKRNHPDVVDVVDILFLFFVILSVLIHLSFAWDN
jgi:hypothetical protein